MFTDELEEEEEDSSEFVNLRANFDEFLEEEEAARWVSKYEEFEAAERYLGSKSSNKQDVDEDFISDDLVIESIEGDEGEDVDIGGKGRKKEGSLEMGEWIDGTGQSGEDVHQETIEDRLARYEKWRSAREEQLSDLHTKILESVSIMLNVGPEILQEGVLDKEEYLRVFNSIFAKGGRKAIRINFQAMGPPPFESGRWVKEFENKKWMMRCCVSDMSEKLFNNCVIVYRLKTDHRIKDEEQLENEIFYAYCDIDLISRSLIDGADVRISGVHGPLTVDDTEWERISKLEGAQAIIDNIVNYFQSFHQLLRIQRKDLKDMVRFDMDWRLYEDHFISGDMPFEKDQRIVIEIEKSVEIWKRLIERAIVESQRLRRESERAGPIDELEYWRRLLVTFLSVVKHIDSDHVKQLFKYLIESESKLMKKWRKVDNHVKAAYILTQDNVKYLHALKKFSYPLYNMNPTEIGVYLPPLLYAIRMINATSRFFNTSKMLTAIFVKMTNQMILACKNYLTDNNTVRIWQDAKSTVISRIKDCIKLYEEYRHYYNEMCKRNKSSLEERPFQMSEVYVFGKFEAFNERLLKIKDVLETMLKFSILQSSTLEGIDVFAKRLDALFDIIYSRTYDPFDHRKMEFQMDYDDFKERVGEIKLELKRFFSNRVAEAVNIADALRVIMRFQKLKLKDLAIDRKLLELVPIYRAEIENVRNRYNEDRSDPPIPRNLPPMTGRILWIRQLYERVEYPMKTFKLRKRVITHDLMQKCIKMYNALISVFVHYEIIHHKAWCESVNIVRLALASPLIIRHPATNKYATNFDPYLIQVIQESEHMVKLGLELPDLIKIVSFFKEKLFVTYEIVCRLIQENNEIRRSCPFLFLNLMQFVLVDLEIAFRPCLSVVTWFSLKLPETCSYIKDILIDLEIFVKQIKDMKEARVDEVFNTIGQTMLLKLSSYPKKPQVVLEENVIFGDSIAATLENKSLAAEKTVASIIDKFMKRISDPTVEDMKYNWLDEKRINKPNRSLTKLLKGPVEPGFFPVPKTTKVDITKAHEECMEVFNYFHHKLVAALVQSTKMSLDFLRKKTDSTRGIALTYTDENDSPIYYTHLIMQTPDILLDPSIEELQFYFNNIVKNLLETHKSIILWGQRHPHYNLNSSSSNLKNYYDNVMENKEIIRNALGLQAAILLLKDDVELLINNCSTKHSHTWDEGRDDIIKEFVHSEPIVEDIKQKFIEYKKWYDEILSIPDRYIIGPVEIRTEKLKSDLLEHADGWRLKLGEELSMNYRNKLKAIVEYIREKNKVLDMSIVNLEDVRIAMKCLAEIRNDFVEHDFELLLIEETYQQLEENRIVVLKEEQAIVATIRGIFNDMLDKAKDVQAIICEMQEPLKEQLTRGITELKKDVQKFHNDFEVEGPMVEGLPAREASARLTIFQFRFGDLWEKYETYSSGEILFGLEMTEYPELQRRKREISLLQKLYSLYLQVMSSIDGYYDIPWQQVDTDIIIAELNDLQNKCRLMPQGMRSWPAFIDLKKRVDDFSETCPLLEMMANKAMKKRHWDELSAVCNYEFDVTSENFTLGDVMKAPLLKHKDDVEDICTCAVKEKDIESKLQQIIADWSIVNLQFANFKKRGELLLKGAESTEIIAALEDSLMIVSSLLANRYNVFFKQEILIWQRKLTNTSEILARWLTVQNLWIYLEAVFIGGDISKQLPAEAKRFNEIDKTWVRLMTGAREKTNAVEACTRNESMGQTLVYLLEQLESCQKSLSGYLETKRAVFPRFCFISDPTLLEILGQASDCHTIQKYLTGLFDNMERVEFSPERYDKIVAMYSRENEKVVLENPVECTGGVEVWLNALSNSHCLSVGWVISQGMIKIFANPDTDIIEVIDNSILQMGLIAIQILWTYNAEMAIRFSIKRDKNMMKKTNQWFLDLLNGLIDVTVKDLTKYARAKYEALITIHVHQRDIFDELCRLRVRSISDFEWLKQCRFYYNDETEEVPVRITNVEFIYQNEFLGCTDRLAITPLTDRCYITLSQAVGMNFGGAPAGPAGTGKTETTKDMGKALGKYVVVFNCSDQMDFRGLGRIFKGLAMAGVWGCFDEFNRIELPVLSVAAQQIAIVLNARKARKTSFLFSDNEYYSLNYEFGIFITMNPGYAGRQELPENLKIQFRSVAMMVPDRQIIIRVKLAACGFRENMVLSKKFFTLYKLCEEQLSKQVHYDFGLRNILSCLRTLGAQKRARPGESEETTLMRVLRDMNLSKLVDEDEPLFLSLIEDMFPGVKLVTQTYKDLQKALVIATEQLGVKNHAEWNLKTVQLYETSLVRHGLMVLGPTGSGKTRCMWALMRALTEMGLPHKEIRMNPKAITAAQMFGRLDVATNDWTDGIFSTLWRRATLMKKSDFIWLVLDGPVDAVWIENLNSVLDDNKTLTLANGDRIVMAPNSKLVFEPDNIDNASPATVSRMGMVFFSASVLKWSPVLEAWLKTRSSLEAEVLRELFRQIYQDATIYVLTQLTSKITLTEAHYIHQTIDLLIGLIKLGYSDEASPANCLEKQFLFSLMWSLGATLETDGRKSLEIFFTSHTSNFNWPKCAANETIFEYFVDSNGQWKHWTSRVADFQYPSDENSTLEFYSILVPNVDNTRTLFLMDLIAKQEKAVLLIGEQGSAKTVMIKSYMEKYDPDLHLKKSFNFSSASTPNMVQRVLESYVEKRVGMTFGPVGGKKMTVFIDDINMPVINEWGDQVTNELTRQLMEYGGFYSLEKPGDFCTILDVTLIAAMIHPGGGRNDIPPRLKRQFNIFNCTLPSEQSMDTIFGKIAEGYFSYSRFNEEIVNFIWNLIPLTRVLWQEIKIKMLPTPAKFHYVFNLRDLSRIWEGMLRIKGTECTSISTLLKLWAHECTRVIADRFINSDDTQWFRDAMIRKAERMLGENFVHFSKDEAYFVNFLREPPEPTGDEPEDFVLEAPKVYEEIPNYEAVIKKVRSTMEQFNEYIRGMSLDLVFFHDALVHLMRISRILGVPRGNAMLVGVGGSGKQSLTRLASFLAGFTFFQIVLTRSYNVNNLMDDLRKLYRESGTESKGLTFIFTDNEIMDEAFLEYINNVLSVGEVANLFAKDELDEILTNIGAIMRKEDPKRPMTQDSLYEYFISRARNNLHLALCFSPVGEAFRSRSLRFPGLISGCTIDWFFRWPKDALFAVSEHSLNNFKVICTPQSKKQLIQVMAECQDSVSDVCTEYYNRFRRQVYVTPKSFLTFLDAYKALYQQHLDRINTLAFRMNSGLSKLVDAATQVDELRKVLKVNLEEIASKNVQVEAIVAVVNEKKREATVVKMQVQKSKDEAEKILKVISKEKAIAERKLEAAAPALEAAEAALMTIKATDIATVRKLGKPPYLITLIMDCVLILFGKKLDLVKPDWEKDFIVPSWPEALKVLADTRFLYNLQNFPKDRINAETVELMIPYLNYPQYNYDAAKQACGNVAGLIQWTISMVTFYGINKDVLPLKMNLVLQEAKFDRANSNLQMAEATLREKDEDLRAVQREFDAVMQERQVIVDLAEVCRSKTDIATAMIDGLAGERVRWTDQLASFKSETDRLIGDAVILTGFLSYTGPFNQEFRNILQRRWYDLTQEKKIPISMTVNVVDSLTDSATIGEWNLQGLPSDELSIQNGIIVTKAARYPLLIDPQLQGKKWIRNKEGAELQPTHPSSKYFRNYLEDCVQLGRPLLIEDIEETMDPILNNLLEKNFIKIGSSIKVKLGDKEVDYNSDFRLYITTKLANPSYSPEIFARTSIIDFTVTMKGLEDQLLGRVILTEKTELETERTQLITDVTTNKRKIQELEANLLHRLTTVQGPLIEDVELMNVLNTTKNTAAEVSEKLIVAKETEVKLNVAREEFRPVATRGSVLYFLICDMANVNCMYQTSLAQFLERFDISIERSEKSPVNQRRINFIIEYLTFEICKYKARGLYEMHKFMFVLLMALKIELQSGSVTHEEFQYLIKGGAALDLSTVSPKPCKWITDVNWLNLIALSSLRQFQYITEQVVTNERYWKVWYDKEAPEEESIPDGYNNLDTFRRLLLIRAWCIDRALSQSRKYIAQSLGTRFAEPIITLLDVVHGESVANTPMICFLSMGSDPTPSIERLAKKMEVICRSISMGQGQEIHARRLMEDARVKGYWVLCQNCHLGLEYMVELVKFLTDIDSTGPLHANFRVWITTEPHKDFPISLLQMSIKYTFEPPQGIRAGLLATYSAMGQESLDQCDVIQFIPLVFTVSFLHTVVQERRKFGPLGWNIPYEFNSADWLASCMFMNNHLSDFDPKRGISWSTVRYMIGEVQYGGRVTDDYDKRLLNTFAKVWFTEDMFAEGFSFYKGYPLLIYKQVSDYLPAIDALPSIDPPQAYGLHPNANIAYMSNATQLVLDTIISVQPKDTSSEGGGVSREDKVASLVEEMLRKLPADYEPFQVKERLRAMGITAPMNIFLKQEIDRIQIVIESIRITMKDLLLGIEGVIIMNEQLRDAFDNIYDARIPQPWKAQSWESSSLGFWFTELLERNRQFYTWLNSGRPVKFWLTGFFNPQGFLTAMKQEMARSRKGWALDNVTLKNTVTKAAGEDVKKPPAEGAFIYGLLLEGAGWDKRNSRLRESSRKVLFVLMPVIHVFAQYNVPEEDPKLYQCPLYKKPRRTYLMFITPLALATIKSPDFWILRGVALLCDNK